MASRSGTRAWRVSWLSDTRHPSELRVSLKVHALSLYRDKARNVLGDKEGDGRPCEELEGCLEVGSLLDVGPHCAPP